MAQKNTFRSALNGFNREDVVQYIEYLNSKHNAQVNQLESEIAELRSTVEALQSQPAAADEEAAPCPDCAALQQQLDAALAEIEELKNVPEGDVTAQELEAYRRAERAERAAKERSEQIYRQATATLAQATTQVDDAAGRVQELVDRVNGQITDLQAAVELSKSALLDAATTMYSIRPEGLE